MNEKRPIKLFGLPGAEQLYLTLADVYEHQIDGRYKIDDLVPVEEWTVADNLQYMPKVDTILNDLLDHVANDAVTEEWYEAAAGVWVEGDPEVKEVVEKLRRVLAGKVKFHMADELVRTWIIDINGGNPKFGGRGEPGEFIYVKSKVE